MKILIASDHGGFNLKQKIINKFSNLNFTDLGCSSAENLVDYPEFAQKLCKKYLEGGYDFGILICGSGIGISIAANRYKKIRAALCCNEEMAILSRQHNDANILCLGARMINEDLAFKMLSSFINSEFLFGRHKKRVLKIDV